MKIKCTLRNIFYKSDNGFIVGVIKVRESDSDELKEYIDKTLTFSGNFIELNEDFDYVFIGELVNHPKYGIQLKVDNYEKIMPEDKSSIIAYLSSGIFPKVGIRTASKIVNTLGDNCLDIILNNYQSLLMIPSMSEKRANEIYEILKEEKMSYKVIIYLQELGFSFNQSTKIYKKYNNDTYNIIENNMYLLVEEIRDIGFNQVDSIALSKDIEKLDERRINACILYSINDICFKTGNTYTLIEDLYLTVVNILKANIDIESLKEYLNNLININKIICEEDKYYLVNYYEMENRIASKINYLLKKKKDKIKNISKTIDILEELFGIKYNDLQKEAVVSSLENNITIITGGPGTGKTTIIKAIVEAYKSINEYTMDDLNKNLVLLAPTGRASKRIREATGFYASTIHKFLKWNKENDEFMVNENNKSYAKLIIIDETSMIDIFLLDNLFKGLFDDVKLIFVGDYNQLPSVLPGQILKDMVDSKVINTIELKDLYRQKEDSYIINLAHEINSGNLSKEAFMKKGDYNFIECDRYSIERLITDICKKYLEKGYSEKDIQILAPMYKGINGIDNLNSKLQDVFNPKKDQLEITYLNNIYRENDKILQTKNISDSDISNGDIGKIESIDLIDNTLLFDFDGETLECSKQDLENIKLGYSISIHKAQGSEFDIVIIPMDTSFSRMLYKKLIYTAVTRAKKYLLLVGEKEALLSSIKNKEDTERFTGLKDRLFKKEKIDV
ncbi:MAG: ATP-dependent RecD-like DNA helicase [Bacilli bacterium]|nr:ATP-dependent RecD-like DNA helicase [Bacilli bacterium]